MNQNTNPFADAYYCELCDEPITDESPTETIWGLMHAECAASELSEDGEAASGHRTPPNIGPKLLTKPIAISFRMRYSIDGTSTRRKERK